MMKNTHKEITELIFRCLIGGAPPSDWEALRRWISLSADNARHFRQLQDLWTSSEAVGSLSRFDGTAAFENFRSRVAADGGFCPDEELTAAESVAVDPAADSDPALPPRRSWLSMPVWMRWAAVILIIAGGCWQFYRHGQQSVERQLARISVEAPDGSRTVTTLPDGTRITLNAGSRITYSQSFGLNDRDVVLSGEAYFEVAHHTGKPFSVTTPSMSVRDIGTKFSLADYPNADEAEVALIEGSVELGNRIASGSVVMRKGQHAVISKHDGHLTITDDATNNDVAWTQHELVLDGKSIYAIAHELERDYSVTVTVKNGQLATLHFYGRFDTRLQSLTDVLNALKTTGKLNYNLTGRKVTLY
ncbi:anti-sigma factor [Hallella multisaccharivorax DSM 17128]|uniref:Anti-FecI sigma factor, FecR n=1 Tax=Hallella multisaccharivorax DSM 17128 TaxID=688246 RepID=F8N9A2_9BACT|nr:FecR domain-containing protein [Hallella multisaccharivorax]EGN57711.1 anti-FecI sigma factor, FecR [Hallella multisaccharivorax DSM 17128]GJG31029.1 anti-sigma factor [Hallella multisaccharivorax DSM 17128]